MNEHWRPPPPSRDDWRAIETRVRKLERDISWLDAEIIRLKRALKSAFHFLISKNSRIEHP